MRYRRSNFLKRIFLPGNVYRVRSWKITYRKNQTYISRPNPVPYVSNTTDCPQNNNADAFVFCLPMLLERKNMNGRPAFRVLLYTSNMDMSCGFRETEHILYNLDWSNKAAWRKLDRKVWAKHRGKTLGYIKSYRNLTQIVIPQAGHMDPTNQPEVSLELVYNFVFQRECDLQSLTSQKLKNK